MKKILFKKPPNERVGGHHIPLQCIVMPVTNFIMPGRLRVDWDGVEIESLERT
jgi:hypothetical protein